MEQQPLGDFAPELNHELSQYHTPVKLARKMVDWMLPEGTDDWKVLEPSAGGGNIVREIVAVGGVVTAFEIDPSWCHVLRQEFKRNVIVREEDFLRGGVFDHQAAIMNPPLDGGVGLLHVKHALTQVPRVVTVLRSQDLHGADRWGFWRDHDLVRLAILSRRPDFGGDHGAKSDFVVAEIERPGNRNEQTIEHWPEPWA